MHKSSGEMVEWIVSRAFRDCNYALIGDVKKNWIVIDWENQQIFIACRNGRCSIDLLAGCRGKDIVLKMIY